MDTVGYSLFRKRLPVPYEGATIPVQVAVILLKSTMSGIKIPVVKSLVHQIYRNLLGSRFQVPGTLVRGYKQGGI